MSSRINKEINQEQMIKIIETLGYAHTATKGSHLLYRHEKSSGIIVMRNAKKKEILPIGISMSIFTSIINSGVADQKEIFEIIENL